MTQGKGLLNERNIFTVLRAATIAAGVIGTAIAALLASIGADCLYMSLTLCEDGESCACFTAASVTGLATVLAVSVCAYIALTAFYRMCGRLREGGAFTRENARAMARIARCFAAAAAALLLCTAAMTVIWGGFVLPHVYLLLLGLACAGAALLCRALALLVGRAEDMQRENELTI